MPHSVQSYVNRLMMTGRVVCGLRLIGAESASDLPHHIAKSAKKMPANMQDKARIVRSIIQNCQSTSRPALTVRAYSSTNKKKPRLGTVRAPAAAQPKCICLLRPKYLLYKAVSVLILILDSPLYLSYSPCRSL